MNSLVQLYGKVKSFAESHNLVNEFILVGSEGDIQNLELNYRSLIMMPLEANISRDLNSPVYTLEFGVMVIDKYSTGVSLSQILSAEENINVIGQLQDYLLQDGTDVDFDSVELTTGIAEDYNISVAMADFTVNIARAPYIRDIDNQ